MRNQKLLRHSDLDSEIMPLAQPIGLFWRLLLIATIFLILVSWALIGALLAMGIDVPLLALCWGPLLGFIVLLAVPILFKARRGAMAILDAVVMTAEAWLARAGYSVDLNSDGAIGHIVPQQIQAPEEIRPILITGNSQVLAHQAPAALPGLEALATDEPTEPTRQRLWSLPAVNGKPPLKVPQETLEAFLDGIFVKGWSRAEWVGPGKLLDRDTYDSLVALLEQTRLLTDRRPGSAGRLAVRSSSSARAWLGLPTNEPG